MSSMVSKSHIKLQDLAPFLRGYDSKSPESAQDWAKGQSTGFAPGMLIFCLEKVAAAPGLAVGRKDETGDSYRVRDLCIVVGEDGGRPLVVNITASAYELRFLEVLMYEKAKKAILDEKDFSFVAVRPVKKLEQSKVEEIEQLGAVYAQGGSRRSLVVDATAPQEPAMALLGSLGVKLTMVGIGKQALDIGYVCLLLFGPEGRTEDKNRAQVRSAFAPVPVTEKLGTTVTTPAPPQAATVWQGPLPSGEVQVPPGSESLLAGGRETISVEKEEGDPGWGSTTFDDEWNQASTTKPGGAGAGAAAADPKASQYSFTPPAGSPPAASWQPPATDVPDFAFAPQPASTFPTPGSSDFQEELSHKTEFEQHLNVGNVGMPSTGKTSSWDDDAPPSTWSQPPAPPAKPDTWQPASPSTISSEWTSPSSSSTPVSDWSAPPAPPSPDWSKPAVASSGDWGSAPGPEDPDWGAPPATPKATVTGGDWGSLPATGSFEQESSSSSAVPSQSQSGAWANAAPPAGTTAGTGAWNTPWAQGGSESEAPGATSASSTESSATESEHAADAEGGAVPKKDANLFNRLYQQLAKGSPSASATNLPQMDREGSLRADEGSANAAQSNLPRLSQELLSRTTAPQSPNASSTNLQPMDPELAAHFRIPLPPPGATPDATVALTPGQSTPQVVSVPQPASPAADTPTFDWGAAANESSKSAENKSGDQSSGESGNEAPSWLESLDRKKATPYSTATNLKPPSTNPVPKKGSTSRVGSASGDFELDQPADLEMLRETGKIKMTPSMKDTVRRRSVEAAAKQIAEQQQQKNEVSPTLAAPASPAKRQGDRPSEQKAEPAEDTKTAEAAEVVENTQAASPGGSAKPKTEDAYKHLAEALSGLMAGDDNQSDIPVSKSEMANSASQEEGTEASDAASQKLSASFKLTKTAEDLEVEPSESVSEKQTDREKVSTEKDFAADVTSPAVPSRFAAMEAALSMPAATPIKPLSIDATSSLSSMNSVNSALTPTAPPAITPVAAPDATSEPAVSETLHDIETVESEEQAASTEPATEPETETAPAEAAKPEPASPVPPVPAVAAFLDKDTNFLITTRTDVPVLEDSLEPSSAAAALDPNLLITSSSDIPSLATQMAAGGTGPGNATADSGAGTKAPRPATFQEPRLVMNEMVTLMNKLEQQVGKAAKKISSRSEEIKQRLNKQVDDLLAAAAQVENQNQVVVQETTAKLSKSLDSSTDEARQNISDLASGGRYSIKQMLTANQQAVDDTKTKLLNDLTKACDEFRKESESLTQECETFLAQFVKDKTDLIDVNLQEITERLDETNASFLAKITARFERFKERMSDEASSIGRSLERNVHSMFEEIDGSWDRASEKLKLTKSEFEQTILHSVKTVELSASQNTRQILISSMAPQLRERTRRLLDLKDSQTKQFMSDTVAQSSLQLQGLESSLAAARQQLHTLVEDCVSNLDGVGRGQQAGLEEIFKSASGKTEKLTNEVQLAIQDAQSRVHENEIICKKLAENSSVDTDVELTDERAATTQAIQKLKGQCNSQIQTALEDACMRLEQMSQKVQNEATNHRMQQTQDARENSEAGLNKIREAIQEAFSAIQSAREQNME